ncbi:MAG: baseplate J/gp47 family protein [Alphaproteobacteria bacterium]|nr:baseplate J/gp47 family protein [Alphaproteobacteria bacterium]
MSIPAELASLPAPDVIEIIDFEARLAAFIETLQAQFYASGLDYDVGALESDPAVILMEAAAYQDINLRQRINEAVYANLLPFATGADLDHLAAWYDVTRDYQETDERLRTRIVLAIQGRSTGGTAPRYKAVAMGADPSVADAVVYTIGRDPTVRVAVFVSGGGAVPPATLATVDAALQNEAVRMVNDMIAVESAVELTVDVTANIWLQPSASSSLIVEIEANLAAAWADEITLGHDITLSWLSAKLHIAGVHRVEIVSPGDDVVIPFNQAPALGVVTITEAGRGF